jgi:hypothetical protein
VAQLCLDLLSYHELTQIQLDDRSNLKNKLKEKRDKDIEECKSRLRGLWHPTGENIGQTDDKIANCVKILIEMKSLIVVFDAIRCVDNLEDAIADALWNEISYRRENRKEVNNSYDPRAEELKWCLVSFSFLLR